MSLKSGWQMFFPFMDGDMSSEMIGRNESLATVRALELLTACMYAHMYFEGTRLCKTFPTVHTTIASLSCMNALVTLEVAGVREAFPTLRAAERLLSSVNPHVRFQVFETSQSLSAETTNEQLFQAVTVVVRDTARTVMGTPAIVDNEATGSSFHVFPDGHLGSFCSQGPPLSVVFVTSSLLVLGFRAPSSFEAKLEIVP